MNREKRDKKFYLTLYKASSVGFSVILAVVIGGAIGWWVDKTFPSLNPWGLLVFLFFGIAAGFLNLYRGFEEIKREDNDKKT